MSLTFSLDTAPLEEAIRQHGDRADRALDRIAVEWAALAKLAITDMIYSRPRTPDEYRLTGRLRASIVAGSPNSPTTQTARALDGSIVTTTVPQTTKEALVGSNVVYARVVHNGLRGHTARPFFLVNQKEVLDYARQVFAEELQP